MVNIYKVKFDCMRYDSAMNFYHADDEESVFRKLLDDNEFREWVLDMILTVIDTNDDCPIYHEIWKCDDENEPITDDMMTEYIKELKDCGKIKVIKVCNN